jgi:hypothetical protein
MYYNSCGCVFRRFDINTKVCESSKDYPKQTSSQQGIVSISDLKILTDEALLKLYLTEINTLKAQLDQSKRGSSPVTPRKQQMAEEDKVRLLERVILTSKNMDSSNSIQKKRIVRRQTWFAAGGRPLIVCFYCVNLF